MINVIAKVTGYHPASGLYLVEGDSYTIDQDFFAADIFTIQNPESKIDVLEGRTE